MEQSSFRLLSARAADIFQGDAQAAGQVEWIYHLLAADPEKGADELEALDRGFSRTAGHEDLAALAVALSELDSNEMLPGRAQVRARLIIGQRRADVEGAASFYDYGKQLLKAANLLDDERIIGDIQCFIGHVARERGNLAEAERSFAKDLAISGRLAGQDPSNSARQQDLATAHGNMGTIQAARGNVTAAERSYVQALTILERLVGLDPNNTGWQRDLATAHSSIGAVAQARGDLAAAERSYAQALTILERLVGLDPNNTGWQRDLATAHSNIGAVAQARGDLA
jgi:tetratricopeptide (TPR) repeat protein